jgi:hypothetical protein
MVTKENPKSFIHSTTHAQCTSWHPCWTELLLTISSAKCASQTRSFMSAELWIGTVVGLGETEIYTPSVTWRQWQNGRMARLNAPNGGDQALFFFETDSDRGLVSGHDGAVCASPVTTWNCLPTQHHVTSKMIYGHYSHIVMHVVCLKSSVTGTRKQTKQKI